MRFHQERAYRESHFIGHSFSHSLSVTLPNSDVTLSETLCMIHSHVNSFDNILRKPINAQPRQRNIEIRCQVILNKAFFLFFWPQERTTISQELATKPILMEFETWPKRGPKLSYADLIL